MLAAKPHTRATGAFARSPKPFIASKPARRHVNARASLESVASTAATVNADTLNITYSALALGMHHEMHGYAAWQTASRPRHVESIVA